MKDKVTLILFSDQLDKALAAFTIANGAAASGQEVCIFFTFWGINLIRKSRLNFNKKNFLQSLFSLLNRGGPERSKLSKFNLGGIGTLFMKILMKKFNMPKLSESISLSKELGVKFIACTTSMELMEISKEELTDNIDSFAGVTTYISNARESAINLFI